MYNRRRCVEEMRAWGLPVESTNTAHAATFQVGDVVSVHALIGRPELNGHIGRVRGYDKVKGRYAVKLASESVLLKALNLTSTDAIKEDMTGDAPSAEEAAKGFIAAASFGGAEAGYVFKRDASGLGYYKDAPPELARDGSPQVAGGGLSRGSVAAVAVVIGAMVVAVWLRWYGDRSVLA